MSENNAEVRPADDMPETPATIEQIVRARLAAGAGFAQEMETLSTALQLDPAYAWTWQCNIAMAVVDEGVDHMVANRAAARFMYNAFRVDITKNPNWESLVAQHEAMKESQVAGVSMSASAADAMSAVWDKNMSLQFIFSDLSRTMSLLTSGNITDNKVAISGIGVKFRKDKGLTEFDPANFPHEETIQWGYDLGVLNDHELPGVTALLHARHYLSHEIQVTDPEAPYLKQIVFKINDTLKWIDAVYVYGMRAKTDGLNIPDPPERTPFDDGSRIVTTANDPELQELNEIEDAAHREYLADRQGEGRDNTDQ